MASKSIKLLKIKEWLDKMQIENYTINEDFTVDVDGNVFLGDLGLTKIPVQFGIIEYNFNVNDNNLTSLEGCPRIVKGTFFCSRNNLKSLEGCPERVEGFYMTMNRYKRFERSKILELCEVIDDEIHVESWITHGKK